MQCSFSTVLGVRFGTYDPFSAAPLDSTGSITVTCRGQGVQITISLGKGSSSTYSERTMHGPGTSVLYYNLFLDAARLSVWGDGTGGTLNYGPSPGSVTATVYGRIPAFQRPTAGSYVDTVTITVNF
jgi:spore coat protein U-like protein